MKAILLVFNLLLISCTHDENHIDDPKNIPLELIGKWKVVQVYETDGSVEPQWRYEDTGATYDYWFMSNGSFMQSDGIYVGIYSVDSDLNLTLTINSSNLVKIEKLISDTLIIDFLNFEPYKQKFIKIISKTR